MKKPKWAQMLVTTNFALKDVKPIIQKYWFAKGAASRTATVQLIGSDKRIIEGSKYDEFVSNMKIKEDYR